MDDFIDTGRQRGTTEARLMAYKEALGKYVRVREPDKATLSELVIKAKGPKRSIRKFAEEIGVSPSTLTRLIRMETASANRDSLIAAIAAHADPDSGVTLDMLMKAHGMMDNDKAGQVQTGSEYNEHCRRIIQDELLTRGYTVAVENEQAEYRHLYDLVLKTDALDYGSHRWAFEFKMILMDPDISQVPSGIGKSEMEVEHIMAMFYTGQAKVDKVSFVLEHKRVFDRMRERYSRIVIPDEISFLLIAGRHVTDEYSIPMTDRESRKIFV